MSKKISLGAAVAFALIVATATYSITMVQAMNSFNDKVYSIKEREAMFSKIAEISGVVRDNYIGVIEESGLMNATAAGFVAGMGDPYAQYFDAAAFAKMQEDNSGKIAQIGIVPASDESGYIKVEEVYPDSPALAAGIEVGDLIVKIDDIDITAENYTEAVAMLKGAAGTKMTILVRKGVEETSLDMTRRFVEVPSVSNVMMDNAIGYVRIKEFNATTPDQFSKQVDALIDQGAAAVIFDVRGVETGTRASVAQVLDKLLPEGVIVSSTNKKGETTVLETSDAREVNLPMEVLANENTSGEAELFAQAIKDFGKGKIIGSKTKGKGTVQTTIPLTDGSAVRLTTARYNPPGGVSYDGEGVKPDFEVKMTADQAVLAAMGTPSADLDPQLKKAVEVAVAGMKAAEQVLASEAAAAETAASDASDAEAASSAAG